MGFSFLGKILIIIGIFIIFWGALLLFIDKIPYIGKLPGDILIKKGNFTFYFPIATCIVLSIFLTLIFYLLGRK